MCEEFSKEKKLKRIFYISAAASRDLAPMSPEMCVGGWVELLLESLIVYDRQEACKITRLLVIPHAVGLSLRIDLFLARQLLHDPLETIISDHKCGGDASLSHRNVSIYPVNDSSNVNVLNMMLTLGSPPWHVPHGIP